MIFITIACLTMMILFGLLLKAIGFGSLGPIAGETIVFMSGNKLTLILIRIIRCMVAILLWRLHYEGQSFCDLTALRDDRLGFLWSDVKFIAINGRVEDFSD